MTRTPAPTGSASSPSTESKAPEEKSTASSAITSVRFSVSRISVPSMLGCAGRQPKKYRVLAARCVRPSVRPHPSRQDMPPTASTDSGASSMSRETLDELINGSQSIKNPALGDTSATIRSLGRRKLYMTDKLAQFWLLKVA
jgi:hypothetical protein